MRNKRKTFDIFTLYTYIYIYNYIKINLYTLEPLAVYLCVARKHHQELLGSFGGTVKETAETIGRAARNYREISGNYREINDVV